MAELTNPLTAYQYFIASPYFAGFSTADSEAMVSFTKYYSNLPQTLKNFLVSEETATSLVLVGIEYELKDREISTIAEFLRRLVLGEIFVQDLPQKVSSELNINLERTQSIMNKIISQTFVPIIEDLKRIQRTKFPDRIIEMQKESRPQGLNQNQQEIKAEQKPEQKTEPNIPTPPKPPAMPFAAKTEPPKVPPQDMAPPQKPPIPPLPQQKAPMQPQAQTSPPQIGPKPQTQSSPTEIPRPQQGPLAPKPLNPEDKKEEIKTPPPIPLTPQQPKLDSVQKPQFKIPDIGLNQPVSSENGDKNGSKAQKSLEDELEKVASVIDLRNKSEN